jgi:CheY-like chemotaxis protein
MNDIHPILIADDDDNDALLMDLAWKRAGIPFPLRRVRDGEEAVAYVQGTGPYSDRAQHPFPLLMFLDLNMPKKNGFEVLEVLRASPEYQTLTIEVLSGSDRKVDVTRALGLGANSYLVKPHGLTDRIEMLTAYHRLMRFRSL